MYDYLAKIILLGPSGSGKSVPPVYFIHAPRASCPASLPFDSLLVSHLSHLLPTLLLSLPLSLLTLV